LPNRQKGGKKKKWLQKKRKGVGVNGYQKIPLQKNHEWQKKSSLTKNLGGIGTEDRTPWGIQFVPTLKKKPSLGGGRLSLGGQSWGGRPARLRSKKKKSLQNREQQKRRYSQFSQKWQMKRGLAKKSQKSKTSNDRAYLKGEWVRNNASSSQGKRARQQTGQKVSPSHH